MPSDNKKRKKVSTTFLTEVTAFSFFGGSEFKYFYCKLSLSCLTYSCGTIIWTIHYCRQEVIIFIVILDQMSQGSSQISPYFGCHSKSCASIDHIRSDNQDCPKWTKSYNWCSYILPVHQYLFCFCLISSSTCEIVLGVIAWWLWLDIWLSL